jgi:RHS repeat-associated protein
MVQDGITRMQIATNTLNSQVTANGLALGSVYVWEVKATDNVNNASVVTLTVASARATKTYCFGSSRVAVKDANVLSYLHSDHLSSVSSSTDVNGKVVGVQLFAPYGEMRGSYEQVAGSWGWATHRKAETNGLTFMRARWYAANVGRFTQPDSIIPNPASPQAFNRYSHTRNNPIRYTDITGRYTDAEIVKIFGKKNYDEVLALFGEKGALSGKWGFLNLLHKAEDGNSFGFVTKGSSIGRFGSIKITNDGLKSAFGDREAWFGCSCDNLPMRLHTLVTQADTYQLLGTRRDGGGYYTISAVGSDEKAIRPDVGKALVSTGSLFIDSLAMLGGDEVFAPSGLWRGASKINTTPL